MYDFFQNADGESDYKAKAKFWLEKAAKRGSNSAKFELWKMDNKSNAEPSINLQQLRDLRECLQDNKEAQLELAMNYAAGNIGNLDRETAALYIKQVRRETLLSRHGGGHSLFGT